MSTSAVSGEALAAAAPPEMRQRQWRVLLGATMRQWRSRIGLAIFVLMVLIAIFGPLIAPHPPTAFVSAPNSPAGARTGCCSAPTRSAATCGAASCTAGGPCSACRWRRRSSASALA